VPSLHRLFHSLRLWWKTWRRLLLAVGYTSTSRRTLGVFATPMSAFFLLRIPRKCCTRLGAACSRTVVRLFPFLPFSGAEWLLFLPCSDVPSGSRMLGFSCKLTYKGTLVVPFITWDHVLFRFDVQIKSGLQGKTKTWNSLIQICLETSTTHFFDWMTFHLDSQSKVRSLILSSMQIFHAWKTCRNLLTSLHIFYIQIRKRNILLLSCTFPLIGVEGDWKIFWQDCEVTFSLFWLCALDDN